MPQVRKDPSGTGEDILVNHHLPAPEPDPDDYSPLYVAMQKRLTELGITEGEGPNILRLLRLYEDKAMDWLDHNGDPEPDDDWTAEDERLYWDERDLYR